MKLIIYKKIIILIKRATPIGRQKQDKHASRRQPNDESVVVMIFGIIQNKYCPDRKGWHLPDEIFEMNRIGP